MQTITVNLNLSRGFCRISQPLYLGETVSLSFSEAGAYSLILTEPFADCPNDGVTVWAQSTEDGVLALNRKALHSAFKKADAMQPNMTVTAKGFVISESGQTVADGEVTIEYSPKAFIIDENEYPLAREVLAQAEAAKNSAVSAKTAAEEAKLKAKGAQSAAEEARDEARSARNEAQEAKTGAEKALSAAKESATTSSSAREDAITAQNASEAARDAAQNAQEAAETARDEAERVAKETATETVEASEKRLQNQILDKVDKEPFNALAQKVDTVVGGDTGKSARNIAAEEVAKVVANAPADFDTLKEIAAYIESDKTGAAQMVTQIDANAKAISDEAERAQEAEAALAGRVKELEEKPAVEVVVPSPDGEGKAADAKAVYEELGRKQDKLTAGAHINIAEDGTISTLGYKLVELPAGETQLQDRANIHITEDNVIRTWAASTDYSGSFIDVDWVHKEVHDIGDGNGEIEWYVARLELNPGFYYPIVPVKDVRADYRYEISYDSQPIPDDPSHEEYKGIVSEVSFIPRRVSSGYANYRTNLYIDFRTKRPDTGEDITWKIDAYDVYGSLYNGGASFSGDYISLEFGDDYIPPEWDEEDYNLAWRFEVSGLSDLPKPGETLKISLVLYNYIDYYDIRATYEGEITLPEDLDWRFEYAYDFTLEGDATIRYSTPDGEEEEVVDQAAYLSIDNSYNYGFVDFNFNTSAQMLPGVTMDYYQWKTVAESEEIQIPTIGEELVFTPSQSTDESSGYSEYFYTHLLMTEHFTFTPPAPSFENRARDFLLCVDLEKDRQIELQDVTEVEGGLFALNAGRTLISVTEPIEGKLYASTRPLPSENA